MATPQDFETLEQNLSALARAVGADVRQLQQGKQDAVLPVIAEAAAGWDYTIAVQRPSIIALTLTVPTCTLLVDSMCQSFKLALTQGTGANKVAWPSNVRWPNGVPPVLSYTQGRIDLFEFLSPDADGQWFGCFAGGGF